MRSWLACFSLAGALLVAHPVSAATSPGEAATKLRALERLFDAVVQDAPRDRIDAATLVQSAGLASADAIGAWMRDNTTLVPYRGLLRGAEGVLEDRAGNALDRALLTAGLLEAAGIKARLARATISEADAAALLASASAPSLQETAATAIAPDARIFLDAGIAPEEVAAAQAEQAEADGVITAERAARRDGLVPLLRDLAGDAPAGLAEAERSGALAALADHWWAEAEVDGQWVALDPSAGLLAAPPAAAAHFAPGETPEDLTHLVTFRVIAETVIEGEAKQTALLSQSFAAHAIASKTITLGFEGGGLGTADAEQSAELVKAAAAAPGWLPRLNLGKEMFSGDGVLLTGEIRPASDAVFASDRGIGGAAAGSIGGAIGALGGMGGGAPEGLFTALWLEVETAAPGLKAQIERRKVFDLVGPEARAAGRMPQEVSEAQAAERGVALLTMIDMMAQTSATSPESAARLASAGMRDAIAFVARALEASAAGRSEPPSKAPPRTPLQLYVYGAARFSGAENIFIDRPNVAAMHTSQVLVGDDITLQVRFDVLHNFVGVTGAEPFAARMAQGVRDTIAEDLVFMFPRDSGNASAQFAAYQAAGVALGRLAPGSLPGEEAALAGAQEAAGYLVFAPERPLDTAGAAIWWRVDPATGSTLGFGPGGYGQASAENIALITNLALRVGGALFCGARMVSAIGRGNTCGAVAGALCLVGTGVTIVGVAGKALGHLSALASQWVGNAGIAVGLTGAGTAQFCN